MSDVFKDKSEGKGTERTYDIDAAQAWSVAVQVFRWDGAGTIEEHRDQNYLLTTVLQQYYGHRYAGMMTYIGAWIEPAGASKAKVTCVVEQSGSQFEFGPIAEEDFHVRFAQALSFIKAGKPLPIGTPPFPKAPLVRCDTSSDCERGVCIEHGCRQ
jgi:hypothetical protein